MSHFKNGGADEQEVSVPGILAWFQCGVDTVFLSYIDFRGVQVSRARSNPKCNSIYEIMLHEKNTIILY
jgi:hypothetical protein